MVRPNHRSVGPSSCRPSRVATAWEATLSRSGQGQHLVDPGRRGLGQDRTGGLGGQALALIPRVQVPAHLGQAGRPVSVGQRQQQERPHRPIGLRFKPGQIQRDDRPQPERAAEACLVGAPSTQALAGFLGAGQRTAWLRPQPARHLVAGVDVEEGGRSDSSPVPQQQARRAQQFPRRTIARSRDSPEPLATTSSVVYNA